MMEMKDLPFDKTNHVEWKSILEISKMNMLVVPDEEGFKLMFSAVNSEGVIDKWSIRFEKEPTDE